MHTSVHNPSLNIAAALHAVSGNISGSSNSSSIVCVLVDDRQSCMHCLNLAQLGLLAGCFRSVCIKVLVPEGAAKHRLAAQVPELQCS